MAMNHGIPGRPFGFRQSGREAMSGGWRVEWKEVEGEENEKAKKKAKRSQ